MIPDLIERERWEEPGWTVAEHTNAGPHPFNLTTAVIIHYTAASTTPESESTVAAYLRRIQRDYAANRGYSIGYNWCVDRHGRVWELRGDDYKCAANGNTTTNNDPAILCLVDAADPANEPMTAAIQDIVTHCEKQAGRSLTVKGHRDVRATSCPGDGLYGQVTAGTFRPTAPEPPTEDNMQYLAEPYRSYDSRETGGVLQPGEVRKVPVVFGTKAHAVITCISEAAQRGWVSAAGDPDAVGKTAVLNFDDEPGVQIRNGSVPLGLPDGHAYIETTVPCHVIVDVFAVG